MENRDFLPTANAQMLRLRARLLRKLRAFFDERGFLEVETPLLSADTVVEPHIDPIAVTLPRDPRRPEVGRKMWLQTSPEFHMKRLLATGEHEAIFQIAKAFRAAERGAKHNPEFTIVEWYRVGDDMPAGMQLLSDICTAVLGTPPAELMSYSAAFERLAKIDPEQATDETLNTALATQIEPNLGRDRPAILYHFPASQAALSQVTIDNRDREVAERFELYVDGVELANGYHELLDADELRHRIQRANEQRTAAGKPVLPSDSRLLVAMEHGLPPCAGAALGFDRLVMVAAGANSIDEVFPFPIEWA